MIETWRQCVNVVGSSAAGAGHAYMAIGALRAGGELREVRVLTGGSGTALTELYLAISGSPVADAASFAVATPLMDGPSQYRHLGKPGWGAAASPYYPVSSVFPFAVRVESGARWVYVAWTVHGTQVISVVGTAVVIGFARMGANGLGVEDGLER